MKPDVLAALRQFADAVKAKFAANAPGEPEAQLSEPVPALLQAVGALTHRPVVAKAESRLGDRLGIPDFGVLAGGALCGYVEVKAPGEGADPARYKGRNKAQWERFRSQPNLIYTDGNEWCLYQDGEPAEGLLRFGKDITKHGGKGVTEADAEKFRAIVTKFLAWNPIVPKTPREQATFLAPLCRLLREDVAEALADPASPLVKLAKDWRALLFPEASDERFADAYAQTVTFALLRGRDFAGSHLAQRACVTYSPHHVRRHGAAMWAMGCAWEGGEDPRWEASRACSVSSRVKTTRGRSTPESGLPVAIRAPI